MDHHARELSREEIDLVSGGNFEIQKSMSEFNNAETTRKAEHEIYMTAVRHLVA